MSAPDTRSPYDGRPYYCNSCGLGYAEFIACEEPTCMLESEATAKARQPCDLGVGCEQAGVCYAAAHGEPERCGRIPTPKPPVQP